MSDGDPEPNETVILELGTPTLGGLLGTPKTATLIVVDSDRKGTIQFAAPVVNVAEANVTATIAVTRTGNLTDAATVEWSDHGRHATARHSGWASTTWHRPAAP